MWRKCEDNVKISLAQDDVIDETRLADADGDSQQAFLVDRRNRFQGREGEEIDVVDRSHRFRLDFLGHDGFQCFYILFAAFISGFGFAQAAGQNQGRLFFFRRKVSIARAPGQTAFFADDGDHIDVDRDIEVADETADDDDLLGVFLTEEGFIGAGNVHQFRDDRSDAAEMDRPLSPAEFMRNVAVELT